MSSLFRAWYVFVGLGLLTFVLTALVGQLPADLSAAVSLPHDMLYRPGVKFRSALAALADRSDLRARVEQLSEETARLEQLNRELALQVEQLQEVVQIRENQSPGVETTAPVIGVSSGSVLQRLTLGKGRVDGIVADMPVTAPQGLVGLVTEVGRSTSSVRLVSDIESRVGVTVRGRGGQGIAIGEVGGRIRVIDFIERDPVSVGDLVETSSYGGLFPRGVLLGEVVEVLPKDPNELRQSFLVQPAVDFSTLLEVALISPQ
ncbi:MAG TPA: rod shape-determining protein MreC [Trueperaceae bacterium]